MSGLIWIQTFDTLMVFLKEFFQKLIFKKSADNKKKQNYPACKELNKYILCISDKDECMIFSPCKNGAQCINEVGNFRCICTKGWTGQNCTDGKAMLKTYFRLPLSTGMFLRLVGRLYCFFIFLILMVWILRYMLVLIFYWQILSKNNEEVAQV